VTGAESGFSYNERIPMNPMATACAIIAVRAVASRGAAIVTGGLPVAMR